MRVERGRTKKLIVAFHFLRGDQARWRCDSCRAQGLEARRRCGFLPEEKRGPVRLVWVQGQVGIEECPRSFVTPESVEWVERYLAQRGGRPGLDSWAREADALQTLSEVAGEVGANDGK